MVTRIGLVVALACIAVPATLMGSTTYFFINENPDFSDAIAETSEAPVWKADIMEVESDSAVSTPDGYEATDTAYIHSLGLLAPSEEVALTAGIYRDWHYDFWANREWGSQIRTWSYGYKLVTVLSGTYRITIPGSVAVRCTTLLESEPIWTPPWATGSWWRVQLTNTWAYSNNYWWHWTQIGRHMWSGPDNRRTKVGPIRY